MEGSLTCLRAALARYEQATTGEDSWVLRMDEARLLARALSAELARRHVMHSPGRRRLSMGGRVVWMDVADGFPCIGLQNGAFLVYEGGRQWRGYGGPTDRAALPALADLLAWLLDAAEPHHSRSAAR